MDNLKTLIKKEYWKDGKVFIKHYLVRRYMRNGFFRQHVFEDPKLHTDMYFYRVYKKHINWESPNTLDEKLGILKYLYGHNALVTQCADKYRVREYVEKKGLAHILNELYGVWEKWEDIDVSDLPDKFVIKRNNDAGGVLVVENKNAVDLQERIAKLGSGLTLEYGISSAELQYSRMEPCYIAEKYIGNEDGGFPYDYKFFCMNGKVRYILVCVGREKGKKMLRFLVDSQFILCPVMRGEQIVTNEEIQEYKPTVLSDMLKAAETISEPFPFVRVDLYEFQGKVLFGEMTFTPLGAINGYFNNEGQLLLGKYLDVSKERFTKEFADADIKGGE